MNRIESLKKLTEDFNKYDCNIYDFCYYLGINNVIDYDERISDADVDKVVDICDYVCGEKEDPIDVGQDIAITIFEDKDITLEQLRQLPVQTIADAYRKGTLENLSIQKESELEMERD